MRELPSGVLTLLFSDIEGSTRLLHQLGGERYAEVLAAHRRLMREAFACYGGAEVDTQGDAFFVVFPQAEQAVAAAAQSQAAHAASEWPEGVELRVRIGLHTGEPLLAGDHYVGIDVHRGARVMSAGHGGQVLLSEGTRSRIEGELPPNVVVRELGEHHLKDFSEPEPLYQLVIGRLPAVFPPLRVSSPLPAVAGLPDYSLPPADVPCPYKGLESFDVEDRDVFFGREELVADLVGRLADTRFLGVVGPSGSGKSSLVRAGVLPAFSEAATGAVILTPGEHPGEALAAVPLGSEMIAVDQFEEVFTLCRSEEERRRFIDELLDRSERGTNVIVALRADIYGHCAAYPRLAAVVERRHALVPPMQAEELRRAIERPAEKAGLVLEPGLVEAILKDVVGEPGALPLLSHSLLETWKRRSDRLLTVMGYLQAGGVQGAIAKTAESVFREALSPKEQSIARNVFLRLTELGDGTEDTRRRATVAELVHRRDQADAVGRVVNLLVDARLLTAGEGTVEVAHEALIRHWPTLRAWLDEDREGQLVHRRLSDAAEEWHRLGEDDALLYRGARLAAAWEWTQKHEERLNDLERAFLAAGRAAERNELEQARRRNRRLRTLVAGLALLLAAAGVLAVLAVRQSERAERQTRRAENQALVAKSRELAAQSLLQLRVEPELSLMLAVEGARTSPTREAEEALRQALESYPVRLVLRGHTDWVDAVRFSPDGNQLLTAGWDGAARVWNADGKQLLLYDEHEGQLFDAAFDPEGRRAVTAGSDGTVRTWDVKTGKTLGIFRKRQEGLEDFRAFVFGASFSPEGRRIVAANGDGTAQVWDLETGRTVVVLRGHDAAAPLLTAEFSPDGEHIVTASGDGTARIWTARSGRPVAVLEGHRDAVLSAAFSSDGQRVVTASWDDTVRIWDARNGKSLRVLRGHTNDVNQAVFSPVGDLVASAASDRTARLFDARTGKTVDVLRGHTGQLSGIAFSPDGTEVMTSSGDRTARVWDIGVTQSSLVLHHDGAVNAAGFSPDGSRVVTASDDKTVSVWDAGTGRSLLVLRGHERESAAANFSPGGSQLVSAGFDGTARVWDAESGDQLAILRGHRGPVFDAAFSPRGDRVVTAGGDDTARVWHVAGRDTVLVLRGHKEDVLTAAFSPDGKHVVTTSGGGEAGEGDVTLRVWDSRSGKEIALVRPRTSDMFFDASFTPDGRHILTAGEDGTARLWDPASKKFIATFRGHAGWVTDAELDPESKWLVTASSDRTARIWDVSTRKVLDVLRGHGGTLWDVAWAPEGARLVTASADGTAQIFLCDLCRPLQELVALAGARVSRGFTAEERARFGLGAAEGHP